MNNKPIDRNGLTIFHISHFCCEVRWHDSTPKCIDVQVCYDDSEVPFMRRTFPADFTLREIKWRTAQCLRLEVEGMLATIERYCAQHGGL